MDELGGFEPTDTTGFIQIESIRIKKYVKIACRELILILCWR
jgi:argininosuccinate synthase